MDKDILTLQEVAEYLKVDERTVHRMLKSKQLRLTVRKSNNNILAQLIEYNPKWDNVVISCHSN